MSATDQTRRVTSTDTATKISSHLRAKEGARSLLEASMTWMDALYDPERALLRYPGESGRHMVRESLWYAFGLVLQQQLGEQDSKQDRLEQTVRSVLDNQYNTPGRIWHGTFKRSPQEADPPDDAVVWKDYDPNWRQFIGTVLVLLRRLEGHRRLADLLPAIDAALVRCIEGEPRDRVPPTYTNIALMKAWLEVECADLVGADIREKGLAYARDISRVYTENGAFPEYNSPTYYGINFYALGLWQTFSDDLKTLGSDISSHLWSDVGRFYHAGMKNLCGPWSRSYGMDMQDYVAALGLWIWAATSRESAPFPADLDNLAHGHDFCLGPIAAVTTVNIPASAAAHLVEFSGTRRINQQISTSPRRRAHAYLSEDLMIGLETSTRSFHGADQYHPLTVHWRDADNRICWSRLRFSGTLHGDLKDNHLKLQFNPDDGVHSATLEFRHPVHLSGQSADLSGRSVRCNGLSMTLATTCELGADGNRLKILFPDPPEELFLSITCRRER